MTNRRSPTPSAAEALGRFRVRDAMQLGLFECDAGDDVATVARTMSEKAIHCVLVAGIVRRDHAGEHLAWGIVSDMDLMRALVLDLRRRSIRGKPPRVPGRLPITRVA